MHIQLHICAAPPVAACLCLVVTDRVLLSLWHLPFAYEHACYELAAHNDAMHCLHSSPFPAFVHDFPLGF